MKTILNRICFISLSLIIHQTSSWAIIENITGKIECKRFHLDHRSNQNKENPQTLKTFTIEFKSSGETTIVESDGLFRNFKFDFTPNSSQTHPEVQKISITDYKLSIVFKTETAPAYNNINTIKPISEIQISYLNDNYILIDIITNDNIIEFSCEKTQNKRRNLNNTDEETISHTIIKNGTHQECVHNGTNLVSNDYDNIYSPSYLFKDVDQAASRFLFPSKNEDFSDDRRHSIYSQEPNIPNTSSQNSYDESLFPKDEKISKKHSLTEVPEARAMSIFNELKHSQDIPFCYPDDGCYARAHAMAQFFDSQGITSAKIFIKGTKELLKTKTPNHPNGYVNWTYHVAPAISVKEESTGQSKIMIMDPSMFDKPVEVKEWVNAQKASPNEKPKLYVKPRFYYSIADMNKKGISFYKSENLDHQKEALIKFNKLLEQRRINIQNQASPELVPNNLNYLNSPNYPNNNNHDSVDKYFN